MANVKTSAFHFKSINLVLQWGMKNTACMHLDICKAYTNIYCMFVNVLLCGMS